MSTAAASAGAGAADVPEPATLARIERLIALPTVSRDSNLGLIEWVRDELARLGVPVRLSWDRARAKANLFATLGTAGGPGLVLSGHTDVVPVDGQEWSHDPFQPRVRDGRLYGRGSADMKSFIGTALAWSERFLEADLDHPLHFAFTYDEEVGCLGVRTLLADLDRAGIRPAACLVGEPTGMRAVIGHKSLHGFRCRVRGLEAHSSLTPQAVNAIEYAARVIVRIRRIADRLRREEARDEGYDVPHSTVNVGLIEGGIALNVVARSCFFEFECRCLPGTDPQALLAELRDYADGELLPEMRAVAARAAIEFEQIVDLPALRNDANAAVVAYARRLLDEPAGGPAGGGDHVAFGTEAGFFQQAGIAAVVCGPGRIAQAHKPDEWIELAQIARCERLMAAIAEGRAGWPFAA